MELTINNLSKTYPNGTRALKNVSLTVGRGMFGLLGQNGAGKSTLMRTVATLQDPDRGGIFLGDIDVLRRPRELRKRLGYLPQEFGVYDNVTALEMLDYVADIKGIIKKKDRQELTAALLHKVNLFEARNKKLGTYSGGMKQRFGIAQALVGDPAIIIVDEPTAGLDPAERKRFHNLLSELGERCIVILSTHIVEDITTLCSDMAVIGGGEVLYRGAPRDLVEQVKGKMWEKQIDRKELAAYEEKFKVASSRLSQGRMTVDVFSEEQPDPSFTLKEPDLEDAYFAVIHPQASFEKREAA
jgi:ABC-type multidrug transport system ATPase subunit